MTWSVSAIIKRKNERDHLKTLFDGSLDKWNTHPIDWESKDRDAKPYHARPYPVPQSQEARLRAEIERLVSFGVLWIVNRSEWASQMFTVTKKDQTLRSIAGLREVNKRIRWKPFPIPKIQELLHKLKGFQHVTSLDLNMGYTTTSDLLPMPPAFARSSYHGESMSTYAYQWDCTTVLISSKRRWASRCKAYNLAELTLTTYWLLIISTGNFNQHLTHLNEVLGQFNECGLKVNAG
jgi:hypothetical protein